ncbi:hypothetical protein [Methanococcus voltae]|uniref:Zn finger protein HypA/HybF involved in hydrogenase expression n=2 Tax=Methanococcus voltae TaxID=2188 RepID=A0A8J7USY4_METVO|nr:hypothetical protein [Methanococcus voltae]MBP2171962.1 Zn finger protein HypA/HybF involved in hydrogenase expression [Methanococcus voltae]MBP2201083.1 Zn finger protein HypA/HybF involved in hydrogenase expression [Methanococcus voltae]MCS3921806.1 Zn finger protein HypA/HybF involved in hydrogenase expression [Methanococcus voltae PS]
MDFESDELKKYTVIDENKLKVKKVVCKFCNHEFEAVGYKTICEKCEKIQKI